MSPPDRPTISQPPPPAASRRDGTAPRSPAQRLLMLLILIGISLSVTIPTLVVTGFFGQRPKPKTPPPALAVQEPGGNLLTVLQKSADSILPTPGALTPDPITVPVRPGHVAARMEKIRRQVAQFGGTATDGVPNGDEGHLFVDLPPTATAAFRRAVTTNEAVETAPPGSPAATAAGGLDHVEIFIRPTGDDE